MQGTGIGGRITKQDILDFIEVSSFESSRRCTSPLLPLLQRGLLPRLAIPGDLVPMTQMRKIIAQRMIESRRTSAHVHCMYEVDLTRIVNLRNKLKNGFEQRHGARLTFMPFFVRAAIIALQQFPSSTLPSMATTSATTACERGHRCRAGLGIDRSRAQECRRAELPRLAARHHRPRRARTHQEAHARQMWKAPPSPSPIPGQFGAVFGLPIINQPNSAIMGVGGITKQPMVITDKDGNDSIAIRSVVHLTLGYDHRLIDGAVADQFMALVKKTLETGAKK